MQNLAIWFANIGTRSSFYSKIYSTFQFSKCHVVRKNHFRSMSFKAPRLTVGKMPLNNIEFLTAVKQVSSWYANVKRLLIYTCSWVKSRTNVIPRYATKICDAIKSTQYISTLWRVTCHLVILLRHPKSRNILKRWGETCMAYLDATCIFRSIDMLTDC